jgi:antitoxin component YwqK of YwqJK toxin-antitoxin module
MKPKLKSISLCLAIIAGPMVHAHAQQCELSGRPIPSDSSLELAGKTGTVRCRDAKGTLIREGEVRDGKWVGSRKHYYPDKGGLRKESQIDERGQPEGLEREYFPGGKLMAERTIRNGQISGREATFFASGNPRWLAFYENGRKLAQTTYDDLRRMEFLQCTRGKDVLPEMHELCGFGQRPVETRLDRGHGKETTLTFSKGVRVADERFEDGRLVARGTLKGNRRTQQTFYSNGKLKLESTTTVDAAGEEVSPPNHTVNQYDPSGQLTHELQTRNGIQVVYNRWYPNGNKAEETRRTVSDKGKEVTITRKFSESGKLLSEERSESFRQPPVPARR